MNKKKNFTDFFYYLKLFSFKTAKIFSEFIQASEFTQTLQILSNVITLFKTLIFNLGLYSTKNEKKMLF